MEVQCRRVPVEASVRQGVPEFLLDPLQGVEYALGVPVGPEVKYPLELLRPESGDELAEILFCGVKTTKRERQHQHVFQIAEVRFEGGAGAKESFAVRLEFTVDRYDGIFSLNALRRFKAFLRFLTEESELAKVEAPWLAIVTFPAAICASAKGFTSPSPIRTA